MKVQIIHKKKKKKKKIGIGDFGAVWYGSLSNIF